MSNLITKSITAPQPGEYDPYYGRYISLVPDNDILDTLQQQVKDTTILLSSLSEKDGDFHYAPEKWTVKQMLGHVIDTERIFAYRALRIARNDQTPMEGFEQDDYVRYGPFQHCRLADLIEEFGFVRNSTLALCRSLDEHAWMRRGVANKKEISVRALIYIIAGHELHHGKVLKEKYLPLLKP
jgi:hypothetical protein